MPCCLRHCAYTSFAAEHSRPWSNGKLPLSGGRGGGAFGGTEAKDIREVLRKTEDPSFPSTVHILT